MEIYRIETGKVRIKKNQLIKSSSMAPKLAKILLDKNWSEWLPIYAWVIDHPEGIIVVDTGETAKTQNRGYLPNWHPYYALAVEFKVEPEDEIGPQLRKMGIDPNHDVSKVILTHLHTDHAGGLHHFPNSEIIIDKNEYNAAQGFTGKLAGYLPHRWPTWLSPNLITLPAVLHEGFTHSQPVTQDRKIILVSTPGHTANHLSVIAEKEDTHYFLAGDTSYTQDNMLRVLPDGVGTNENINTLQKIRSYSQLHPTIYLPSHDPDAPRRMANKEIAQGYFETQKV